MKVVLDLTRLRTEGSITAEEYDRLLALSGTEGASVAISVLIGFGVIAVSAAALALVPSPLAAIGLGAVLLVVGTALLMRAPGWTVLGTIVLVVAALLFGGGILLVTEGTPTAFLVVAASFATAAVFAGSGLLSVLSVLVLFGALGSSGRYGHALYTLSVPQPAASVVLFAMLALGLYALSRRLAPSGERLALIAARAALFLVNLGFWVGSLWGDRLGGAAGRSGTGAAIPDLVFVVGWAGALLGVGVWAVRRNRRWVLNLAAVFGGIHFYTQWFERLGAAPLSLLVAGLLLLGIALSLWRWNERFAARGLTPDP